MTDVAITIRTIDETTKGTKSAQSNLKALATTVAAVGASLAAMGITVKKVFDWGEQGAAISQTRESFELFLEKVDAAPGLLDALRSASRGTIKDVDLMSSTMTLAAGAEEELAKSLIDATPRLLEIAKAANKLNPALGDTAFMYQSIATGVKRASPLILDNLGLTIKVGEANEKYAQTLGKSAKELTVTEQKMALLNATMEAGDTLIAQAGGSTESATDAFQQLRVIIGETWDEIRVGISEVLLPLVKQFVDTRKESQEFADVLKELGITTEPTIGDFQDLTIYVDRLGNVIGYTKDDVLKYAEAQRGVDDAIQASVDDMREYREFMEWIINPTKEVTKVTRELTEEMIEMSEAAIKELNYLIGVDLEDTLQDHEATMEDLQIQYDETKAAIDEMIKKYGGIDRIPSFKQDEWVELQNELGKTRQAIDEEEKAWKRNTQEILFNMAARALEQLPIDLQSEALGALAESMGLIDEPTKEAWENIGTLTQMLSEGKIDADEYGDLIENLGVHLTNLPEEVSPEVALLVTGLDDLERAYYILRQLGVRTPLPLPEPQRRQFGGPVEAGMPYWVGESGQPELFVPSQSGTITPVGQYGSSTGSLSIGSITVNVGEGADGEAIADQIMTAIQRKVEMANISGAGYVGI